MSVRIRIAGLALADRWETALFTRGHATAAYRVGRIGARLFARPDLCTCGPCRKNGITHPAVLSRTTFLAGVTR